jgi:putative exosortase-associated protein (TIGR04073 family)
MKKNRGKRHLGILCLAVLFAFVLVSPAFAEGNPGDKLVRGVKNTFTGWLEIPDEINDASKETNPFTALTYGLAQGSGEAVTRTGVGGHDIATFLIPDYDKPHMDEENVF